jgi:hypothetical protein
MAGYDGVDILTSKDDGVGICRFAFRVENYRAECSGLLESLRLQATCNPYDSRFRHDCLRAFFGFRKQSAPSEL